jgi:hypothetical protein
MAAKRSTWEKSVEPRKERPDAPVRRKPDSVRKTAQIRIRISQAEKESFSELAQRFGLEVSSWLRMLGATAVRKEKLRTREACKEEGNSGGRTS